jgi:rfaE bifunctional protein nucleotidyltransferase chain/domain
MENTSGKIMLNHEDLASLAAIWKEQGLKVVFTNGCFDLIHLGHIQYLREAAAQGDKLIVALNADASVSRIKGPHRPINNQQTRLEVMAAFEFTDAVTLFTEDDPYALILKVKPNVLVKGGDWAVDQIVGSDVVLAAGGTVKSLTFAPGYSTTLLEQKIIKAHQQ